MGFGVQSSGLRVSRIQGSGFSISDLKSRLEERVVGQEQIPSLYEMVPKSTVGWLTT